MSCSPDAIDDAASPRTPQFHASPAPSPAMNTQLAGTTIAMTENHTKSPTLQLPTQRFAVHVTAPESRAPASSASLTEQRAPAGGESPHIDAGNEPKDASAVGAGWGTESQKRTPSPADDSASSPPIGSPASPPPRVISATQSRRSTLKNFDSFKSALQATQQKALDAADGSDGACASNLEADLQLAGQIGEALLSENSKLEARVEELSTTLQAEQEAKQAVLEENAALKAQLEELSKLHAETSSIASSCLSPVAAGSPAGRMRAASRSPAAKTPMSSRPRQLDTRAGAGGEEGSIFTLSELAGSAEDERSGQEELMSSLVAFLRSELGSQSNLARSTPGSATHSGSVMMGMGELRMNSPSPNGSSLLSPAQHDRMGSSGGANGGSIAAVLSPSSSSASTFSTSPAAPLNPSLLVEDLNAVLRKLRKERRVADLERSNCAAMMQAMEKEVAVAKSWVAEHQADVESVAALRQQLEQLQQQLDLSKSQAKEEAATASVEAKLKLQQAKRHLETSIKQLEEELRLDRLEAAALLAQRNELARRSNTLEQQVQQDQELLRQAQLENQTLKHSHAQLASLTSQLRDELEQSMSQIQARDGQITALSSSTSQGTQELVDLRRELARAESELAASTQAHIAQLAAITSGFERKLEAEVSRALAAAEQRAAENLLHHEAELLAAHEAALLAQRTCIEEQLESQRLETEQAITTQATAFLEKQKLNMLLGNNEDAQQVQGREEILLRCVELNSPDVSAAAQHKKELGQSSEVPSDSQSMSIQLLVSPQSTGSSSSASDDGSFLSPISTFATSGSPPASASPMFSPAGSSCSSTTSRSSATPVSFNLSLKHLQLKFPATPSRLVAASSSTKHQPVMAPLSAPARSPPVQCCSETQTSPLPAANDSQISFSVDAPVASHSTQLAPHASVLSPEPNRSRSPASRARLMESPLPGQNVSAASMSTSQSFVAASPNKTNRQFHAMHSSVAATLSAAGALPPRSPAQQVRAGVQQQQQAADSATQHRLALLSSVGKALSVVTGSSPVNTRVGSTPPAPIGRSPLTSSVSPSAPNVAAALSTAMTPKSSAAAKVTSVAASANAGSGLGSSIYVLPLPPFAVSPSDQLALAYLYRYLHATWIQAFSWLQSSPCKDRALWIRDETAGHCFSCQKHWTLTSRRHHCRLCGALFCGTCSRFRLELPHSEPDSQLVRCCLRCFGAQQSMTLSNSLALWEQQGTLEPPPERSWIGTSIVLGSPAAKREATQQGRRGSLNVPSSLLAPHSDATLPASVESSTARSTRLGSRAGEAGSSSSDDGDDEGDDSSDEYATTDEEDQDHEHHDRHGAVLDDEREQHSSSSKQTSQAGQSVGGTPA